MSQGSHSSEDLNSAQPVVAASHEVFKKIETWARESSEDKTVARLLSDLLEQLVSYYVTLRLLSDLARGGYDTAKEMLENFSNFSNDEARYQIITLADHVGSVLVAIALDRKVMASFSDVVQWTIQQLEREKEGQSRSRDNFNKQRESIAIAYAQIKKFRQQQKANRTQMISSANIVLPFVELGIQYLHKTTTQDHNRFRTQVEQCTLAIQQLKAVLEDLDIFEKQMAAVEPHWESLQEPLSRISKSLADHRSVHLQPALQQDLQQLREGFRVLQHNNEDDSASSQPTIDN